MTYLSHFFIPNPSVMAILPKQNIFDTLIVQLFDSGQYKSLAEAILDLEGNDAKIINKCRQVMSPDQASFYDKVLNAIISMNINNDNNINSVSKSIHSCNGLPGTGKSFLQNAIHAYCLKNKICVQSVAPTNYIALQQGGITINKAIRDFCYNVLKITNFRVDENIIKKFKEKFGDAYYENTKFSDMSLPTLIETIGQCYSSKYKNTYLNKDKENNDNDSKRLPSKVNVVLIDEGSMITNVSLAALLCSTPATQKTIYILFYGQNQLPPVSPNYNLLACYNVDWGEYSSGNIYSLTTQQRFKKRDDDANTAVFNEFVSYFSQNCFKEEKTVDLEMIKYFIENIKIGGDLMDYKKLKGEKILIVATNEKRKQENELRLISDGEGPIFQIPAMVDPGIPDDYKFYPNLGIDSVLKIRKGSICYCRANLLSIGLVKGMMVKVEEILFDKEEKKTLDNGDDEGNSNDDNKKTIVLYIKVSIGSRMVTLTRENFETQYIKNKKKGEMAIVKQFPITLGYAITSHGAQGKTLNCNVGINLIDTHNSHDDVLDNMFFVAITRVRKPSQIFMKNHPAHWLLGGENAVKDMESINFYSNNIKKKKLCDTDFLTDREKKICNNDYRGIIQDDVYKKITSFYPK